jgi:hypothetical protein
VPPDALSVPAVLFALESRLFACLSAGFAAESAFGGGVWVRSFASAAFSSIMLANASPSAGRVGGGDGGRET